MLKETIDLDELNKFQKTYKEWNDREGEFKILHEISNLRIDYVQKMIERHFLANQINSICDIHKNLNILDIGCGGGILLSKLIESGYQNLTGIDPNETNIIACKEKLKSKVNLFNHSSLQHIEYLKSKKTSQENLQAYDVIISLEVIEHVASPEIFISHISKLLKKNGMIIISTINKNIKAYLLAVIASENILGYTAKNTHDYNKFIDPASLNQIFKKYGLSISRMDGLNLNLKNFEWEITDDISINYFAVVNQITI